ncbi:DUF4981 domain-containing protein [Streptomyces sp. NPDC047085]|uniref:DUF4981 domain-containing protein n=1 Tax=Streptomyces sp. NPDC047085 TaxID=3155140 RepID=UPI0033C9D668
MSEGGEGRPDGPGEPVGLDGPGRCAGAGPYDSTAPVGIRSHRHEGIVLANRQRRRGLGWLAATWELSVADGRVLSAPAELPALCPGETAAVPLPFALPRDGGTMWLTLRVTTAEDEPGAPRGTEVCAPRLRLHVTAHPDAPVRQPGRVVHLDTTHRVLRTTSPVPSPSPSPSHPAYAAV